MNFRHLPLTLLLLLAVIPCAYAQQGDGAADLVRRGVQLRSQGNDEGALRLFQQAYEADRSPVALAQMALAEQALGLWVEAQEHLRAALNTHDTWIDSNRQPLEGAAAVIEKHVGLLDVRCEVLGAKVYANDTLVGTIPFTKPIPIVAGSVVLTVRADGYHTITRQVQVSGAQVTRETVQLVSVPKEEPKPVAAAAGPTTTTVVVKTESSRDRDDAHSPRVSPEQARRGRIQRGVGWGSIALAAAGVGGIGWAVAVHESKTKHYNSGSCAPQTDPQTKKTTSRGERCPDDLDAADTAQTWGIVAGTAAASFSLAAILLFLTAPETASSARATRCGSGPGTWGLACSIQF